MTAQHALGKQFHGTTADLQPGEKILPANQVGRGRGKSVWLAPHPTAARTWGEARAMRDGHITTAADGWATSASVPVHVYEVEPHNAQVDRNGWVKAEHAVVKRRVET